MPRTRRIAAAILVLAMLAPAARADGQAGTPYASEHGVYTVSYESLLDPIVINRMHSWILTVKNAAGEPVDDAEITVDGGMPAHNHGLPTQPRVTQNLGEGRYMVEGLRFHMQGHWEMKIGIEAGGKADTVIIPLDL
jgi:YtkA-like